MGRHTRGGVHGEGCTGEAGMGRGARGGVREEVRTGDTACSPCESVSVEANPEPQSHLQMTVTQATPEPK